MKNYTLIYKEPFDLIINESEYNIIKYIPIKCYPKELKDEINAKIGSENIIYVFDGHCEISKDWIEEMSFIANSLG